MVCKTTNRPCSDIVCVVRCNLVPTLLVTAVALVVIALLAKFKVSQFRKIHTYWPLFVLGAIGCVALAVLKCLYHRCCYCPIASAKPPLLPPPGQVKRPNIPSPPKNDKSTAADLFHTAESHAYGKKKDNRKAFENYKKAYHAFKKEKMNSFEFQLAAFFFAHCYEEGIHVKNEASAITLYKQAAELGHKESCHALALLAANDTKIPLNQRVENFLFWYEKTQKEDAIRNIRENFSNVEGERKVELLANYANLAFTLKNALIREAEIIHKIGLSVIDLSKKT